MLAKEKTKTQRTGLKVRSNATAIATATKKTTKQHDGRQMGWQIETNLTLWSGPSG